MTVTNQSDIKVIDNDKIRPKDKDNRDKDRDRDRDKEKEKDKERRDKERDGEKNKDKENKDNENRAKEKEKNEEEIVKDDPEMVSRHIRLYNEFLKAKEIDIANDIKATLPKLKPFTSDESSLFYNNRKNSHRYNSSNTNFNNRANDSYFHSRSRRYNDYNYYNKQY